MRIMWFEDAWNDYLYWQSQDKKTLRKVNTLLKDIQRNPFNGIGEPEPLRSTFSGWWSRRIDDKNRIVYKIEDAQVIIAQCKGHYEE